MNAFYLFSFNKLVSEMQYIALFLIITVDFIHIISVEVNFQFTTNSFILFYIYNLNGKHMFILFTWFIFLYDVFLNHMTLYTYLLHNSNIIFNNVRIIKITLFKCRHWGCFLFSLVNSALELTQF